MSVEAPAREKRAYTGRVMRTQPLLTDPAPARAVREVLAAAKLAGEPFDVAWARATAALPFGQWRTALLATEAEWRACFYDRVSLGGSVREFLAA